MSPRQAKPKVSSKASPSIVRDDEPLADSAGRLERIATSAYYKAESRGFVPGMELDDWLEAEAEYDSATEER